MKTSPKRLFPRLLFILTILVFSGIIRSGGGLNAQPSIGFGPLGLFGMPDTTVSSGNTVLVGSRIVNYDTSNTYTYADTIQIFGNIDTGSTLIQFSLPPVTGITILPGDSIFFLMPFIFLDSQMGGNLRIGNNVIVVWPKSFDPNFATHDSIWANLFILDPNGVPEHNFEGDVHCYPIPAGGPLYVTSNNQSLKVKEVVIRDAAGKIMAVSKTPSLGIDTDSWASGIYFLEITFENGQQSAYKIIR